MRSQRAFRPSTWATLLLLAGAPPPAEAKSGSIRKESFQSGGRQRVCYVYRPESLPSQAPMPLLLLLHGSGADGSSLVKEWRKLADSEGILLAGPDSLNRRIWNVPEDGPQLFPDVVAFLRSRYTVDGRRIYLLGSSGGAVFALKMGPVESEFFAAVAVHAGAFRDKTDFIVLSYATRKIPVFFVVGTEDPLFSVETVRETKNAFEAKGLPVELLEIPGHGHGYHERGEEVSRKIWDFLSTKHLDHEARYTSYRIP